MAPHEFEITGVATPEVERALAGIGRCEDVCFSPDGRMLVLAGFHRNAVLVVDIEVDAGDGPIVHLTRATEAVVPGLERPHGIDFIDDETLVVANRGRGLSVLTIHRTGDPADGRGHRVEPVDVRGTFVGLDSPGSVTVVDRRDGGAELLVCNNQGNTVTRHRLTRSGTGFVVSNQEVLLERWLDVPDGVAVSPDGEWVAVSDHHPLAVLLYRIADGLGPDSVPSSVLRGVAFPHGLRFTSDGEVLIVAAAATAEILVFTRPADGWGGVHHPASAVRVLDEETFERGRVNPEEGGPKGVALSPDGHLVAVTSEHVPLVLLDAAAVVAAARRGHPPADPMAYERSVLAQLASQRSEYLTGLGRAGEAVARARAEAAAAQEARAAVTTAARRAEAAQASARAFAVEAHVRAERAASQVAALEATWTFRILGPLRRGYARVRRH